MVILLTACTHTQTNPDDPTVDKTSNQIIIEYRVSAAGADQVQTLLENGNYSFTSEITKKEFSKTLTQEEIDAIKNKIESDNYLRLKYTQKDEKNLICESSSTLRIRHNGRTNTLEYPCVGIDTKSTKEVSVKSEELLNLLPKE